MITTIEPFLIQAWLAGVGIALMSAPVGCFIAWQRLVYFGDTVAHAAVLGVVLAVCFSLSPLAGLLAVSVLVALLVASLHDDMFLPSDTLLGILAHASLALGFVIISMSPDLNVNIDELLFGDILIVDGRDLALIYPAAAAALLILATQWKKLMRYVLHADIAQVEGVNTRFMRLLLMVMIAVIVAISIRLVGVLLITSLMILPAAAARMVSRSPGQMAITATFLSMLAVTLGIPLSVYLDAVTGPIIILTAFAMLVLLAPFRKR